MASSKYSKRTCVECGAKKPINEMVRVGSRYACKGWISSCARNYIARQDAATAEKNRSNSDLIQTEKLIDERMKEIRALERTRILAKQAYKENIYYSADVGDFIAASKSYIGAIEKHRSATSFDWQSTFTPYEEAFNSIRNDVFSQKTSVLRSLKSKVDEQDEISVELEMEKEYKILFHNAEVSLPTLSDYAGGGPEPSEDNVDLIEEDSGPKGRSIFGRYFLNSIIGLGVIIGFEFFLTKDLRSSFIFDEAMVAENSAAALTLAWAVGWFVKFLFFGVKRSLKI